MPGRSAGSAMTSKVSVKRSCRRNRRPNGWSSWSRGLIASCGSRNVRGLPRLIEGGGLDQPASPRSVRQEAARVARASVPAVDHRHQSGVRPSMANGHFTSIRTLWKNAEATPGPSSGRGRRARRVLDRGRYRLGTPARPETKRSRPRSRSGRRPGGRRGIPGRASSGRESTRPAAGRTRSPAPAWRPARTGGRGSRREPARGAGSGGAGRPTSGSSRPGGIRIAGRNQPTRTGRVARWETRSRGRPEPARTGAPDDGQRVEPKGTRPRPDQPGRAADPQRDPRQADRRPRPRRPGPSPGRPAGAARGLGIGPAAPPRSMGSRRPADRANADSHPARTSPLAWAGAVEIGRQDRRRGPRRSNRGTGLSAASGSSARVESSPARAQASDGRAGGTGSSPGRPAPRRPPPPGSRRAGRPPVGRGGPASGEGPRSDRRSSINRPRPTPRPARRPVRPPASGPRRSSRGAGRTRRRSAAWCRAGPPSSGRSPRRRPG